MFPSKSSFLLKTLFFADELQPVEFLRWNFDSVRRGQRGPGVALHLCGVCLPICSDPAICARIAVRQLADSEHLRMWAVYVWRLACERNVTQPVSALSRFNANRFGTGHKGREGNIHRCVSVPLPKHCGWGWPLERCMGGRRPQRSSSVRRLLLWQRLMQECRHGQVAQQPDVSGGLHEHRVQIQRQLPSVLTTAVAASITATASSFTSRARSTVALAAQRDWMPGKLPLQRHKEKCKHLLQQRARRTAARWTVQKLVHDAGLAELRMRVRMRLWQPDRSSLLKSRHLVGWARQGHLRRPRLSQHRLPRRRHRHPDRGAVRRSLRQATRMQRLQLLADETGRQRRVLSSALSGWEA